MRRGRGWRSEGESVVDVYYIRAPAVLLVAGVEYGIDAWISIAWRTRG